MKHQDEARRLPGLRGPELLTASFQQTPVLSSDRSESKEIAVCSWRVEIDQYRVGDMPEILIGLHTEGIVYQRTRGGWGPEHSRPGQLTLIPPGDGASYRCDGTLGVTTVHLSIPRLDNLLGQSDSKRLLESIRMRLGFNEIDFPAPHNPEKHRNPAEDVSSRL